jgi:hypothetical protein
LISSIFVRKHHFFSLFSLPFSLGLLQKATAPAEMRGQDLGFYDNQNAAPVSRGGIAGL